MPNIHTCGCNHPSFGECSHQSIVSPASTTWTASAVSMACRITGADHAELTRTLGRSTVCHAVGSTLPGSNTARVIVARLHGGVGTRDERRAKVCAALRNGIDVDVQVELAFPDATLARRRKLSAAVTWSIAAAKLLVSPDGHGDYVGRTLMSIANKQQCHRCHFSPFVLVPRPSPGSEKGGLIPEVTAVPVRTAILTGDQIRNGAVARLRDHTLLFPPSVLECVGPHVIPADAGSMMIATLDAAAQTAAFSPPSKRPRPTTSPDKVPKALAECTGITMLDCFQAGDDAGFRGAVTTLFEAEAAIAVSNSSLSRHVTEGHSGVLYNDQLVPRSRTNLMADTEGLGCRDLIEHCVRVGVDCKSVSGLTPKPSVEERPDRDRRLAANATAIREHMLVADLPGAENGEQEPTFWMRGSGRAATFMCVACVNRGGARGGVRDSRVSHCHECGALKQSLRQRVRRRLGGSDSKFTPHDKLPPVDAVSRLRAQSTAVHALQKATARLELRLDLMTKVLSQLEQGTTDAPDSILSVDTALKMVGPDGEELAAEATTTLLDTQFPPGSHERQFYDCHVNNVRSQVRTGSKLGVRYPAVIQHTALQLISKVGRSSWDKLSGLLPNLPSYRTVSELKNFVSASEDGPLHSVLDAMRRTFDDLGFTEGAPERLGVLCTDDMYLVGNIAWSASGQHIIGFSSIKDTEKLMSAELQREYEHALSRAEGRTSSHTSSGEKVATKYSIFIWSSLGSQKISFPVGRFGSSDVDTGVLHSMLRPVLQACLEHGFDVCAITMDGASTNRSVSDDLATISASEFFSDADMAEFERVDFDVNIAMEHPWHGRARPIFLIFDPPHWLKKLRNAAYASNSHKAYDHRGLPYSKGNMRSPRDLKFPKPPREPLPEAGVSIERAPPGDDGAMQVRVHGSGVDRYASILTSLGAERSDDGTWIAPARLGDAVVTAVESASCGAWVLDLRRAPDHPPATTIFELMEPVNLKMVQRGVGRLPGNSGFENELTVNAFKLRDFEMSDASAKMNVATASRVFSQKAQRAVRWAGGKGLLPFKHPRLPAFSEYGGLMQFVEHVDDMWDIVNTKIRPDEPSRSKSVVYSDQDPQLRHLLQHLSFFHGWRSAVHATPGVSKSQKEASFLPAETWAETRSICLGFPALVKHYVKPRPRADQHVPRRDGWLDGVAFRRVTSDPAENHFADVRLYATGSKGLGFAEASAATSVAASVSVSKVQGAKRKVNSGDAEADANIEMKQPFTRKRLKNARDKELAADRAKFGIP